MRVLWLHDPPFRLSGWKRVTVLCCIGQDRPFDVFYLRHFCASSIKAVSTVSICPRSIVSRTNYSPPLQDIYWSCRIHNSRLEPNPWGSGSFQGRFLSGRHPCHVCAPSQATTSPLLRPLLVASGNEGRQSDLTQEILCFFRRRVQSAVKDRRGVQVQVRDGVWLRKWRRVAHDTRYRWITLAGASRLPVCVSTRSDSNRSDVSIQSDLRPVSMLTLSHAQRRGFRSSMMVGWLI